MIELRTRAKRNEPALLKNNRLVWIALRHAPNLRPDLRFATFIEIYTHRYALLHSHVIKFHTAIDLVDKYRVDEYRNPVGPNETPITDLDLRNKTFRILRYLKVKTIGDLLRFTSKDIQRTRTCGVNTVKDIKRELDSLHIPWK